MEYTTCRSCGVSKIPANRPLRKCEKCLKKNSDLTVEIRHGVPAAIIKTGEGVQVFVDKNGKEVPNPGYDLENDPRGYRYRGTTKDRTML